MTTAALTEEIVIGPDDNGLLMTPEEFDAVVEWNELYHYELIRGVLVVLPIAGAAERDANDELGHLLRNYQSLRPGILDATIYSQYVRTADSRRLADRVVWVGLGRTPSPTRDVPAIVVDFVSKRRRHRLRDYVSKRDEYLAVGVVEIWVIDRFQRTLTVFRKAGRNLEQLLITESEKYETPLLPGFELPFVRLLDLADDWQSEEADE